MNMITVVYRSDSFVATNLSFQIVNAIINRSNEIDMIMILLLIAPSNRSEQTNMITVLLGQITLCL